MAQGRADRRQRRERLPCRRSQGLDGRIGAVGGPESIDLDGAWLLPASCHVHICVMTEAADHSLLLINSLPGEIALYA